MTNKVNRKKLVLKEIFASVDPYPNPAAGGPYGFGGERQITKLDPSVKKVQSQEQDEINQNIEDQAWSLGKFLGGPSLQDIYSDELHVDKTNPQKHLGEDLGPQDINYGNMMLYPRMNAIENQKIFVPGGPEPRNPEHYFIDDLEDEINFRDHAALGIDEARIKNSKQFEIRKKIKDIEKDIMELSYLVSMSKKPELSYTVNTLKKELKRLKNFLSCSITENNLEEF